MAWHVEHTDTFSGEANYSWVRRYVIEENLYKPLSALAVIRRAKALTGLSGVRCRVERYGDHYRIDPQGLCQVVFVDWKERR